MDALIVGLISALSLGPILTALVTYRLHRQGREANVQQVKAQIQHVEATTTALWQSMHEDCTKRLQVVEERLHRTEERQRVTEMRLAECELGRQEDRRQMAILREEIAELQGGK